MEAGALGHLIGLGVAVIMGGLFVYYTYIKPKRDAKNKGVKR